MRRSILALALLPILVAFDGGPWPNDDATQGYHDDPANLPAHKTRHDQGGADELKAEDLGSALTSDQVLTGDDAGGRQAKTVGTTFTGSGDPNGSQKCKTLLDTFRRDTDGTAGNGDEITYHCRKVGDATTAEWEPITQDLQEFCEAGGKALGYDAAKDRYRVTCADYAWSAENGGTTGGVGDYETPTTPGGNAYNVDCTGLYTPDTACRSADDTPRINFAPDAMLAQDHTLDGGKVIFTDRYVYVHRGCGEQADGTANNCPVLRPPLDTQVARQIQVMRGVEWVGARVDPTGYIDGANGTVWLNDTGHDNAGTDPQDDTALVSNWVFNVGLASGAHTCSADANGDCTVQTNRIRLRGALWGNSSEILAPDLTSRQVCLDNRLTTTGTCQGDRRIAGTTNGECDFSAGTGARAVDFGPAEGFVDALETDQADGPVTLSFLIESANPTEDSFTGTQYGVHAQIETIGGGCAVGDGRLVTLTGKPFINESLDSLPIATVNVVPPRIRNHGGGLRSMSFAGAQSRQYEDKAADLPNGSSLFAGDVVVLTDDDGSCTDGNTDGALDGGGGTVSECEWSGSAWGVADCPATDSSASGCQDNTELINVRHTVGGHIRDFNVFHYGLGLGLAGGDGFSIQDGASTAQGAVIERGVFAFNRGRITDPSRWDFREIRMFGNQGGADFTLFSVCFSPQRGLVERLIFEQSSGIDELVSMGQQARSCVLRDIFSSGNDVTRAQVRIKRGYGVHIDGWQGVGNQGAFALIEPSEVSADGSDGGEGIVIEHVRDEANRELRQASSQKAAVVLSDFDSASSDNAILEGLTIRDSYFETQTTDVAMVWFDGVADDATVNEDDWRKNVHIESSQLISADGAGNARAFAMGTGNDITVDAGIYTSRFLPTWRDISVNRKPIPDQPHHSVAATEVGECSSGAVDEVDEVPEGTVVMIHTDATASGTCASSDGEADGEEELDGGGSFRSLCECDAGLWSQR